MRCAGASGETRRGSPAPAAGRRTSKPNLPSGFGSAGPQRVRLGRVEAPVEHLQVEVHPLPVGVRLDAVRAQEIGGDQRRDHARDEQAHQHRHDDGEAERLEILAGDAGHQRDREEHRDDRHGRRQHREADFVGGVERRLIGRLAHAHVADDVLDLDDRVVDQHAGDQAHGHRRHEVERDPEHAHEPEGGDRRQRDGQRGDQRRADVAEEEEDDENRQDRALDQPFHRRIDTAPWCSRRC